MKIILTIIMICTYIQSYAQSEPDSFNKKDLIEKLDRSDLDMDSSEPVEINDSTLKFEIPKIEFDSPVKKQKKISVKKPTTTAVIVEKTKKPSKPITAEKNNTATKDKVKVVFAKRPILISQIHKNDKIVVSNGKILVYRLLKKNIIQYKFKGKIPFDSKGLKANDENSYYVVNKKILIADTKKSKAQVAQSKPIKTTIKPIEKSITKPVIITKKTTVKPLPPITNSLTNSSGLAEKRKIIEGKYNNGKEIKNSLFLRNLHQKDEVYIVGDIQFVIRKSAGSSSKKRYWLIEKLDFNNNAVQKIGNNRYKIIKFYKTN